MRGSATRDVKGADLKMEHEFRLLERDIDKKSRRQYCGSTTGRIEIGKLGRVGVIPGHLSLKWRDFPRAGYFDPYTVGARGRHRPGG
jgi:hypothetical protein